MPRPVPVLRQVETVAPSDSAVVICGETGTGKELIARAIHDLSNRKNSTFVKLNCAAVPPGLLESELFGHERGAFTGAVSRGGSDASNSPMAAPFCSMKSARFRSSCNPKLLRVLQEQEFERIGSNKTIRVNVRVVSSTNRDLPAMVRDRKFRADLFYRLHVFPIQLPSLRERREDIPAAGPPLRATVRAPARKADHVHFFRVDGSHDPDPAGNVRELQNLVERAVILSEGGILRVPVEGTDTGGGLSLRGRRGGNS